MSVSWRIKRVAPYLTFGLVVCIIVFGVALAWPNFQRSQTLRSQAKELDFDIEEKKKEIAHLQENRERFRKDRDFVEQLARQNRRVFTGEFVFQFEKEDEER